MISLQKALADLRTRDKVCRLVLGLANESDEGRISWAQRLGKSVATDDGADTIQLAARYSGTSPSSRPV